MFIKELKQFFFAINAEYIIQDIVKIYFCALVLCMKVPSYYAVKKGE